MKDLAQMAIIVVVIWGCVLAAPVFGLIVGSVAAAWIINSAWKEEKNERRKRTGN